MLSQIEIIFAWPFPLQCIYYEIDKQHDLKHVSRLTSVDLWLDPKFYCPFC